MPQAVWENPLNVIPLFTEEDKAAVAARKEKGFEEVGIKEVARRFEAVKIQVCCCIFCATLIVLRGLQD